MDGDAARALYAAGRAAWPGVPLPEGDFLAHLSARAAAVPSKEGYLGRVQGDGLYLACACARGVPEAIAALEERYLGQVPQFLSRLSPAADLVEEVKQRLRIKLLPMGEDAPKIADYSGEGSLGSWLRVVALREALTLLRRRGDAPLPTRGDDALLGESPDPELALMKERYQGQFAAAFRDAIAALSAEQRNLLRLHFVDGLNIDQFGAMFQVHRSTAARWLQAAREAVLAETRRLLSERLRLQPGELDSVIRVVRSQLDVSIARLLGA